MVKFYSDNKYFNFSLEILYNFRTVYSSAILDPKNQNDTSYLKILNYKLNIVCKVIESKEQQN